MNPGTIIGWALAILLVIVVVYLLLHLAGAA